MENVQDYTLENWVITHAQFANMKLFFTINGDVPLTDSEGKQIYYEVPSRGRRVCVLHPDHLTRVAQICYEYGVQMIQVML